MLLLSQETSNFAGRYVQLRDARCEPKPVQQPHPPIVIGGNGPTRTLRTVARFAQQWNSTAGIDHWPAIKTTLEKRCAEAGRDPATIDCSVNLRYDPSAGAGALAESAAAFAEAGADIAIVGLPVPHTASVLEPIAEALRPLRGLIAAGSTRSSEPHVRDGLRAEELDALIAGRRVAEVLQEPLTAAEQDRHDRHVQLVDQAGA